VRYAKKTSLAFGLRPFTRDYQSFATAANTGAFGMVRITRKPVVELVER